MRTMPFSRMKQEVADDDPKKQGEERRGGKEARGSEKGEQEVKED